MELARGTVTDRPWGRTLGALALKGVTGQLTVTADGKPFCIAFDGGTIVGATSPLAADAAVRIAMTAGLLSSTQVSDIARRQAAAPGRDEVEMIAEAAKLGPDHSLRLRRRALAQRAARTFSLDRGTFVVEDSVTIPIVDGAALDIRTVVYMGAKGNLSEQRLNGDLAQMGSWFRLKPDAAEDLPLFGFSANEQPVIDLLADGALLADLEATVMDSRAVHAVLYALVSCSACEIQQPPPPPTRVDENTTDRKVPIPQARAPVAPAPPKPMRNDPPTARGLDGPTMMRPRTASRPPPPKKNQADSAQASDILALIGERLKLLDQRVDHYTLLGVPQDVAPEVLRKQYFALAKQLHPDRLASMGITDVDRNAQRLFAEVNTAFGVLNDADRRAEYTNVLRRGGEAAIRAEQALAEETTRKVLESEEHFRRGEQALKRDQIATAISELSSAIELNPDEADYHAALAWAHFCAAPDKMATASTTRASLTKAIAKSPRAVTARFYLGRVERMLGKDKEALDHFNEVIRLQPQHAEAKSEARVIQARLDSKKR